MDTLTTARRQTPPPFLPPLASLNQSSPNSPILSPSQTLSCTYGIPYALVKLMEWDPLIRVRENERHAKRDDKPAATKLRTHIGMPPVPVMEHTVAGVTAHDVAQTPALMAREVVGVVPTAGAVLVLIPRLVSSATGGIRGEGSSGQTGALGLGWGGSERLAGSLA